jgi:hypothetical protein
MTEGKKVVIVSLGEQGRHAVNELEKIWKGDVPDALIVASDDANDAELTDKVLQTIRQLGVEQWNAQVYVFTPLGDHLLDVPMDWEAPTHLFVYLPDDISSQTALLSKVFSRFSQKRNFVMVPFSRTNINGDRLKSDEQAYGMMARGVMVRESIHPGNSAYQWNERLWAAELGGATGADSDKTTALGLQQMVYPDMIVLSVCQLGVALQAFAKLLYNTFNKEYNLYVKTPHKIDEINLAYRFLHGAKLYSETTNPEEVKERVRQFESKLFKAFRDEDYCLTDCLYVTRKAAELINSESLEASELLNKLAEQIYAVGQPILEHINAISNEQNRCLKILDGLKNTVDMKAVEGLRDASFCNRRVADRLTEELRRLFCEDVDEIEDCFKKLCPKTEFSAIKPFLDKQAIEFGLEVHDEYIAEHDFPRLIGVNLLDNIYYRTQTGSEYDAGFVVRKLLAESLPLIPLKPLGQKAWVKIQPFIVLPEAETEKQRLAAELLKKTFSMDMPEDATHRAPVFATSKCKSQITVMQMVCNYGLNDLDGYEEQVEAAPMADVVPTHDVPPMNDVPPVYNYELYIASNGQSYGPYRTDQWEYLCNGGWLTPATYVWMQGMENWQQASQISVLEYLWKKQK